MFGHDSARRRAELYRPTDHHPKSLMFTHYSYTFIYICRLPHKLWSKSSTNSPLSIYSATTTTSIMHAWPAVCCASKTSGFAALSIHRIREVSSAARDSRLSLYIYIVLSVGDFPFAATQIKTSAVRSPINVTSYMWTHWCWYLDFLLKTTNYGISPQYCARVI